MDLSTKLEKLDISEEERKAFEEIDTPLKFLKVCFPTYEDKVLLSKLEACGGDIENTVDVISNDELRNLEIFGVDLSSTTPQEDNLRPTVPKAQVTEPSRHKINTPGNFSKARKQQRGAVPKLRPVLKKEEFPDLVSTTKPVNKPPVTSSSKPQQPPPLPPIQPRMTLRQQEEFEEDLSHLASIFPEHDVSILSAILQDSTSLQNAIDNVLQNTDTYKSADKHGRPGTKAKLIFSGQRNIREIHDNPELEIQKSKNVPNLSAYRVQSVEDPEYCRKKAIENITKRNELFMKAARAFSGKSYGSGGVAFFYSQEGKSYDSKVKQWNARAAQATLMQNQLRVSDPHTVDLHGLTVSEALVVVKDTVNDWYSREEMKSGRSYFKPLTIITGVGHNSPSYNSRLGPAVINRLNKDGWKLDVSRKGFVVVKGIKM